MIMVSSSLLLCKWTSFVDYAHLVKIFDIKFGNLPLFMWFYVLDCDREISYYK